MTRAGLVLVLALVACRRAPEPPRGPSPLVRAELERAETAERARQHDVARVHYERAIAIAPDPPSQAYARREFAETLATWGEIDEAIAQLEAALAIRPGDAAGWHDLGLLRFKAGHTAGAIVALERSRQAAPKDYRPRRTLAVLRWKIGDRPGAAAEYRSMLELELPERLRTSVEWALAELAKPAPGVPAKAPPSAERP